MWSFPSAGTPFPLGDLPGDCLSVVLSFCPPRDICRLACTNRTWKQAAETEEAWRRNLPWRHTLIASHSHPHSHSHSHSHSLPSSSTDSASSLPPSSPFPALAAAANPRQAFDLLRQGVTSADGGFLLQADATTGLMSLHASAYRNLDITWLDKAREDNGYWTTRRHVAGCDFDTCAYLIRVCWFHLAGRLHPDIPLLPGRYRLSWRVAKCPRNFVWSPHHRGNSTVALAGDNRVLQDVAVDFSSPGLPCKIPKRAPPASSAAAATAAASGSTRSGGGSVGSGSATFFGSASATPGPATPAPSSRAGAPRPPARAASPNPAAAAGAPGAGPEMDAFDIPWWLKPIARWGFRKLLDALENADVVEVSTGRPTAAGPGQPQAQGANNNINNNNNNDPIQVAVRHRPVSGVQALQQMLHDVQHTVGSMEAEGGAGNGNGGEVPRELPALQRTLGNIQAEINAHSLESSSRRRHPPTAPAGRAAAAAAPPANPAANPLGNPAANPRVVYAAAQNGPAYTFQFRFSSGNQEGQASQATAAAAGPALQQAETSSTPGEEEGGSVGQEETNPNPVMQFLGGVGSLLTQGLMGGGEAREDRDAVRWEEYPIGDVVLEDAGDGLARFDGQVSLSETASGWWKSGLYVDSFVIRQC